MQKCTFRERKVYFITISMIYETNLFKSDKNYILIIHPAKNIYIYTIKSESYTLV